VAIVLLAGAAVFAFTLGVSAVVMALASPVRRRLGRLASPEAESASRTSAFADLLRPFSRYILPSKESERSGAERRLVHAGLRPTTALPLYYASKALLMIALPFAVLVASPFFPRVSTTQLMLGAGFAAFFGALLPSMWLDRRVQRRQRALRVGFPDALDLLVVCVEAGLGLAPALQRVADDLEVSHPELGAELTLVNAEMRAGVERTQALKNLADRTGLEDIRGLVALLVQTMRFGTGVAEALRVYSEEFRDKRMQAAEEQAALIGTKMIFPLVTCLFPSFFLVMVGPAIVKLVEVFRNFGH
jgi:tight adherence protein C